MAIHWYDVVVDPFRPLTRLLAPLLAWPRWPQVRGLVIGLHLLAVVAVACPAPIRGMSADGWQRPAVREELEGWSRRLTAIGFQSSPNDVKALSITVQRRWIQARKAVVWPFQAYLRTVNAPQGWYMFTGPDRDPQRFVLAFTSTGTDAETLVFELGRPPARPDLIHPDFLDDHRIRRAMFQTSWSRSENTFRLICDALATRVRARATAADAVDDIHCRLVARRVEHPYRRHEPRPDRVERELIVHKDGSSTENKMGVEGRRRPARPTKTLVTPTNPPSTASEGAR